jgi:hypothetical protein
MAEQRAAFGLTGVTTSSPVPASDLTAPDREAPFGRMPNPGAKNP